MPRNPDEYSIGYRKPPVHTRFQKGQSGNPKGSKKGSKTLAKHIREELDRRITVTENGQRKTITKAEAIVKQLINKAVGGDAKVIPLILSEDRQHQVEASGAAATGETWTSEEDQKVILGLLERMRGDDEEDGHGQ
jgi:hypothetical protein